jgi:RimJ/RimL family protein N-acetyltransferase
MVIDPTPVEPAAAVIELPAIREGDAMPDEPLAVRVHALEPADWEFLMTIRLRALKDSPRAFAGSYSTESSWDERRWRAEFADRTWYVACSPPVAHPVGLAREFRIAEVPEERHIESMWVDPGYRGRKVATAIVHAIIERVRQDPRVTTVSLRVLDGNDLARTVYERLGFCSTGHVEPLRLPEQELRFEERLTRRL